MRRVKLRKSVTRKRVFSLSTCALGLVCCAPLGISQQRSRTVAQPALAGAQESAAEVLRINTRVVFIDTLVKDKRTSEPITDLTRDDFEVFDNGKRRVISYFSREGDDHKRPMALLLILAPMDDGARKSFQRPEILNSMAAALSKLPPEDEVAVMLLERAGIGQMLTPLTRDRARVVSTLANLPKPKQVEAKTLVRPSKIIRDVALSTTAERPNSQVTIVMLTDSVFLMENADRDELERNLIRSNVTLNALITGSSKFFMLFYPVLKPMENHGVSYFDVPQYIAKQTGGDYVRANKKKDYGPALERLVGNLTTRYSLGFTLGENEPDDGQMHRLEVRVKAKDSQDKERTIELSARQGYYLPKTK